MIHKKVTKANMNAFTDELRELLKKYQFAAVAGIVISNNTASDFKMVADGVLLGSDHQRMNVAFQLIGQMADGFTGSIKIV
jgi:hypothetical protein